MKTINLTIEEVELLRERFEAEVIEVEKYLSNLRGVLSKLGGPVDKNSVKQTDQEPKRRGRKPKNETKPGVKKGNHGRKPKAEKLDVQAAAVTKEPKKKIVSKPIKKEIPTPKEIKKQVVPKKPVSSPKKVAPKPVIKKLTGAKPTSPKADKSNKAPVKKVNNPITPKTVEPQVEVGEQPVNPTM